MKQILGIAINLLAGDGGGAAWYNYPGWEAWKFLNLFLFFGILFYFLRRPLSESLLARRESIKRELMKAQEERSAALAKLVEVEARLSRLDAEIETARAQTQREAAEEKDRITRTTEAEMRKLREQARREIESAGKVARQDLRRYAAEQSAKLAEELIRGDMRAEDDSRLMKEYVEELGGVRR